MKIQLFKMKADQKVLSIEIRTLKNKRQELKGYVPGLLKAQNSYRATHIAYCMLRGKTIEQIEPKLRDTKDWTHTLVREHANRIVASVLNPQPVVKTVQPKAEVKKETLWNRVLNFLS